MFTSLRRSDQALFLTGILAAAAGGCSKKSSEPMRTAESASSAAEARPITDSAAASHTDTAASALPESAMAKVPPVKSSAGDKPKPLPKPSIDPGRKSDSTAPSVRVTIPAAQTAPASAQSTGPDQWLKYDAATNTVTFELIAGPFNFNGYANGAATLTLPSKANVVINFVNKDGTPHSAEVVSGEGPIPNAAGDPAIPRAYTNKALEGLPQEATDDMRFSVQESGKYRIFCGVPGHGLSGMWIWMVVDPAAKTPSFGPTKV